jgi:hypothetical protein
MNQSSDVIQLAMDNGISIGNVGSPDRRRTSLALAQPRRGQHPRIIPVAHRPANAGMILGTDPFKTFLQKLKT